MGDATWRFHTVEKVEEEKLAAERWSAAGGWIRPV
jgi:hypothetical protein